MRVLTLSTLDPDVENFEQYLEELNSEEFDQLLKVANLNSNDISDDDFIDISALSANLYSTEMDINPEIVIEDTEMLKTIIERFLSSIIIYSLIKKEMVIKSPNECITLYKELYFETTEKGRIMNDLFN